MTFHLKKKIKFYTTSEYMSTDTSSEKKKNSHYKNETLHN